MTNLRRCEVRGARCEAFPPLRAGASAFFRSLRRGGQRFRRAPPSREPPGGPQVDQNQVQAFGRAAGATFFGISQQPRACGHSLRRALLRGGVARSQVALFLPFPFFSGMLLVSVVVRW